MVCLAPLTQDPTPGILTPPPSLRRVAGRGVARQRGVAGRAGQGSPEWQRAGAGVGVARRGVRAGRWPQALYVTDSGRPAFPAQPEAAIPLPYPATPPSLLLPPPATHRQPAGVGPVGLALLKERARTRRCRGGLPHQHFTPFGLSRLGVRPQRKPPAAPSPWRGCERGSGDAGGAGDARAAHGGAVRPLSAWVWPATTNWARPRLARPGAQPRRGRSGSAALQGWVIGPRRASERAVPALDRESPAPLKCCHGGTWRLNLHLWSSGGQDALQVRRRGPSRSR